MSHFRRASVLFIVSHILCQSFGNTAIGEERSLSRRKRYVVFPEGSSFSIALCMTVHTLTPDNIFTEGLNWGISYDLPNESKPGLEPFLELRKDPARPGVKYDHGSGYAKYTKQRPASWNAKNDYDKYPSPRYPQAAVVGGGKKYYKPDYNYIRRRHRRELYNKLEIIMNAMGFEGRTCVLRALCEASQRLMPKGNTLVEEMMRIAFTLPLKRVLSYEPEEHRTYTDAHRAGHEGRNCPAMFPGCSFSLIDMALGKYSASGTSGDDDDDDDDDDDAEGSDELQDEPSPTYWTNARASVKEEDPVARTFDPIAESSNLVRYNMK